MQKLIMCLDAGKRIDIFENILDGVCNATHLIVGNHYYWVIENFSY